MSVFYKLNQGSNKLNFVTDHPGHHPINFISQHAPWFPATHHSQPHTPAPHHHPHHCHNPHCSWSDLVCVMWSDLPVSSTFLYQPLDSTTLLTSSHPLYSIHITIHHPPPFFLPCHIPLQTCT